MKRQPHRKIRLALLSLLIILSLGMVNLIIWQDYRGNGDIAVDRAFASAWNKFLELPRLTAGPASPAPDLIVEAGVETTPAQPPDQAVSVADESADLGAQRQLMLGLINADRIRYGVAPVALGTNPAAQWHAEDMLRHNFRSHWGTDGLAPYMRYTLAGGFNRESQNVSGPDVLTSPLADRTESPATLLADVQADFMNSTEHRLNILNRWHRKVNLGIACNFSTCWVVQQFESDHVRFESLPSLFRGTISFDGTFDDGLTLDGIAIWRYLPPQPLTLGQLDATYSYGAGQYPVTFLRPPLPGDRYYPDSVVNYGWKTGIDPYTLDPSLARIDTPPLRVDITQTRSVPWTTAALWETYGSAFRVQADLSPIIETAGPGVYTVQIWAQDGKERVPLTNYSLWVE